MNRRLTLALKAAAAAKNMKFKLYWLSVAESLRSVEPIPHMYNKTE